MLEVARRRARPSPGERPAPVSRRPVRPACERLAALRRRGLLAHLPAEFELLTLAPLVPLGTHSALGPVSQDKVVTAMRACEAAADPTNALALEAAGRRLAQRGEPVRLAAFQRVVRAQQVEPGYLPHFSLLGLVTAGRDDGGHRFEREAVAEHVAPSRPGLQRPGGPQPAGAHAAVGAGEAVGDAFLASSPRPG